jgi:hypothetical protein
MTGTKKEIKDLAIKITRNKVEEAVEQDNIKTVKKELKKLLQYTKNNVSNINEPQKIFIFSIYCEKFEIALYLKKEYNINDKTLIESILFENDASYRIKNNHEKYTNFIRKHKLKLIEKHDD